MQTFVSRLIKNKSSVDLIIIGIIIFVVFPLGLDIFRLNLVGKYLTFAFTSIGLVMLWGYGGILSLGQGIFFGIGGYCMAMYLKLEASDPVSTSHQTTPGIPDFMDWNQITQLPSFWIPFHSLLFTIVAIIVIPIIIATLIGTSMFKRRVSGVYFSIITQAIAAIVTILVVGQQGFTGGINGITDLKTLHGWNINSDFAKYILYFINGGLLILCIVLCKYVTSTKLGRLLLALRDKEDRVRFSGYDVANFKIFAFALAAVISSIGGAMFTLQVGFMSPSIIGIVPSIEMVIFAAIGGRMSLIGAVYGALVVNYGKTLFSESFPTLWLFFMGALFIGVVMFFPEGLSGLYLKYWPMVKNKLMNKFWAKKTVTGSSIS
ncbi:MAG: urea ABC transporter permease subunit UrtC [Ferrovum sp. 37-45-19]|uniref:urea ABC transporter permease subunit UrtC n=1 Tax=Ferrovum sp. JA12 TaxID=1356299 RepID=UPI000703199F|nr:leucine/isoleucine/valine transporter permease subunit [Ferrovum sp. JA12]OYV79906.1 MAG: urea ABC transporter permease subunit UrtC [Ferrovum sp. 21-44-67]OYV95531.1 MAG: urea ABC transporter permease subunit UrtC [Ferrovum sp. 37-45-19]HQT81910.1 urea ABC transporter permease subunit UrtC [Ferrovaceae bacterium]HQU05782.1 urea ABC transporter permease subunit UrtC [Ferrovaceae bacterium]